MKHRAITLALAVLSIGAAVVWYGRARVQVREAPGGEVHIIVVDGHSSAPLEEATVRARYGGGAPSGAAATEADGFVAIACPPGSATIDISGSLHDGMVGRCRVDERTKTSPDPLASVVLSVYEPGQIEVRVATESGERVEGVAVALHFVRPPDRVRVPVAAVDGTIEPQEADTTAVTDTAGRVVFESVAAGVWRCVVRDETYEAAAAVEVRPAATARVELALRRSVLLRGRVVESTGVAVADAELAVVPWSRSRDVGGRDAAKFGRTDSSGRFSLPSVARGRYAIYLRRAGRTGWNRWGLIRVSEAPLIIIWERERASCVRIVDERGLPASGVPVDMLLDDGATRVAGVTDADGRLEAGIDERRRVARVSIRDRRWCIDECRAPIETVSSLPVPGWASWDIRVRRARRVTGAVLADDRPARGADVLIVTPDRASSDNCGTGGDGRFDGFCYPGHAGTVSVGLPGWLPAAHPIPAGDGDFEVSTIRLRPAARITGTLVPESEADRLLVVATDARGARVARPLPDGRFCISGLVPGATYSVAWRGARGECDLLNVTAPGVATLSVAPQETCVVEIEPSAWASLCAIRGEERMSWSVLPAYIGASSGPVDQMRVPRSRRGLFALETAAQGPVYVGPVALDSARADRLGPPGFHTLSVQVNGPEGTGVELAAVSSRMVDLDGTETAAPAITFLEREDVLVGTTGADGSCSVRELQAGVYSVVCRTPGGSSERVQVRVPSEQPIVLTLAPSRVLRGVVTWSDGRGPVWGAVVRTEDASDTYVTGEDGRFELRGAAGRRPVIAVNAPPDGALNIMPVSTEWVAGGSSAEIVAREGEIIGGTLLTREGAPLRYVQISARPVEAEARPRTSVTWTDGRGAFRLVGLEPGEYALRASVVGGPDPWVSG